MSQSRAPLIFGLTKSSMETVREGLALADQLGGRVWLDRSEGDLGRIAAFSQVGRVSATLGEVKNRADVVVFIGADPLTSHPRHWERYSVRTSGRFIGGRENREVIVVNSDAVRRPIRRICSWSAPPNLNTNGFLSCVFLLRIIM